MLSTKTMRYYTSDGFNKVVDFEHNKYDVWFKDFDKRKGDFSFDIGQNEFNNNEMTIFVNSKVKNKNDELIGVVAVSLGIYRLQRIIANYEKQYDIQISITDDEGNMLIDNDIQNLKGVHHLDISSRSTRKSNQYFFQKVSSTQNVISRFNKELGMYIVIRSNHTIFTNQFKFLWLINAILFGIVALLLALAIFIVNRNHSKLVKYSFVDEMTKLFNRRCYEEDLFDLNNLPQLDPDLLYIMADVNGLKDVNDHKGHSAGDELIKGAALCLTVAFGHLGKVYRLGGHYFRAVLSAKEDTIEMLKASFDAIMNSWKGKLVPGVHLSVGMVSKHECPESATLKEIIELCDRRMYQAKEEYYKTIEHDNHKYK